MLFNNFCFRLSRPRDAIPSLRIEDADFKVVKRSKEVLDKAKDFKL